MNNLLNRFKKTPDIRSFLAYSGSFLCYGGVITALGPYIPYLSAQSGHLQTQYSFLFLCRAIGFIVGGLLLKVIEKFVNNHTIIVITSLLMMLVMTGLSFQKNMQIQGVYIFIISILCCFLEVVVNGSILKKYRNNSQQFWLQLNHGVFGVGGIIGPFHVYLFQKHAFTIMGVLLALSTIPYYWLRSPQQDLKIQNSINKKQRQPSNISPIIQRFLCFLFFMYLGLETSYGGWISSYTVLAGVSNKEQATFYSSIFWISMTIFRFFSACVSGLTSVKLKILYIMTTIIGLISIFMIQYLNWIKVTVYLTAFGFGATFAPIFPLILTLPTEFKLCLSNSQNANLLIFAALGEGILSMLVGEGMSLISINIFFYSFVLFSLSMNLIHNFVISQLQKQKSSLNNQSIQMNQIFIQKIKQ